MGTSSGAYELNHAPERVPICYYRDKTRVQISYFDSNTTVHLQCAALAFFGKRMLTGCRLVDCSLGSQYNFISDAYKTNSVTASRSMNGYFNDARFNFYKDDFAMHNFY